MFLYHGSEHIIREPLFGYGNKNNDYGLGFYCTEDIELAKEWASSGDKRAYANVYEMSCDKLKILNLSGKEYNILNWLAILLENRSFISNTPIANEAREYILEKFMIEYKNADIIKGYRADDSYFTFARMFLNNTISLEQLAKAMKLGNLGEQIVLKSEKAFRQIEYIEAIPVDCIEYGIKRNNRDKSAREDFEKMKGMASKGIFVMDIVRERWTNSDERLQ